MMVSSFRSEDIYRPDVL